MRPPRRVPWASKQELGELYEMLFSPSADVGSKQRGLARMNVYISSPSCPAFIPLLHSLVTASLLPSPPLSPTEAMSTRMTCAMSIVRFVNGMVDPLQNGPYARPISHIAATLGMPPMLISIRHRATHEDLPPLPLLVHSVHIAIDYLNHYAFLPILASSSENSLANDTARRASEKAGHLVTVWKRVMKVRIRDKEVGEENATGLALRRVKKELDSVDPEDIVVALCGSSGLVPVARKKRPSYNSNNPPRASLQVWRPFLEHLAEYYPTCVPSLAEQIVSILENPQHIPSTSSQTLEQDQTAELDVSRVEQRKEAESFRWCLSTWLLWLWSQEREGALKLKEADREGWMRRILSGLLTGDRVIRQLHKALSVHHLELAAIDGLLVNGDDGESENEEEEEELKGLEDDRLPATATAAAETDNLEALSDGKVENQVDEMERRLLILEQRRRDTISRSQAAVVDTVKERTWSESQDLPPGWKLLKGAEWRECPIGIWGGA